MILNGDVIFMLFHSFRSSPLTHPLLFSVPLRTHPPPPRASILSRRKQFKARSFFIFNNSFIFLSLSLGKTHSHTYADSADCVDRNILAKCFRCYLVGFPVLLVLLFSTAPTAIHSYEWVDNVNDAVQAG